MTKRMECINFLQLEIWDAYSRKYKLSRKETTDIFNKNKIWNYIKSSYEAIEQDPIDELVTKVRKVIISNEEGNKPR